MQTTLGGLARRIDLRRLDEPAIARGLFNACVLRGAFKTRRSAEDLGGVWVQHHWLGALFERAAGRLLSAGPARA